MKKLILVAILASIAIATQAQDNNTTTTTSTSNNTRAHFGVKGGLNISSLFVGDSRVDNEKYRVGANAGIYGYGGITNFFGIQTEVLYSGKGTRISKYNDAVGVDAGQINFNLHYLEVPVFAKFNIGPIGIGAGVYGAYLLDANMSNINYRSDFPTVNRYDISDKDFNKFDFGGLLDVSINAKNITAGIRYSEGFRKVSNSTAGNYFLGDAKNAVASVYIGFGI
jgi:Outer membrane protein beta-barrel domain